MSLESVVDFSVRRRGMVLVVWGAVLLTAIGARDCMASLQRRRIRLPWKIVNEWLSQIGQRPL